MFCKHTLQTLCLCVGFLPYKHFYSRLVNATPLPQFCINDQLIIIIDDNELEKLTKNWNLAIEITQLWLKYITVVPNVIGALDTMSKNFMKHTKKLQLLATTPA